ncbi:hypothetical protein PCANC_11198 [Puccinia coronata f. sp. avenae]|uniref:Uncharacterized protein n=1 Tax=Puccinia coronata f. sp. avenae TaxID=200324 RepID=A0A2N5V8L1_9BASI|nr:hypothetical protein PCANC_11198 [Puccinia coronata f. sp. avenae]
MTQNSYIPGVDLGPSLCSSFHAPHNLALRYTLYRPAEDNTSWKGRYILHRPPWRTGGSAPVRREGIVLGRPVRVYRSVEDNVPSTDR